MAIFVIPPPPKKNNNPCHIMTWAVNFTIFKKMTLWTYYNNNAFSLTLPPMPLKAQKKII